MARRRTAPLWSPAQHPLSGSWLSDLHGFLFLASWHLQGFFLGTLITEISDLSSYSQWKWHRLAGWRVKYSFQDKHVFNERVPARRPDNQSSFILNQASRGRCVNGWGAVLLVTSQWILQMILEMPFHRRRKKWLCVLWKFFRILALHLKKPCNTPSVAADTKM